MLHALKLFFTLINTVLSRLIGIADDVTYTTAAAAGQLRHEAVQGLTEGCAIVDKRDQQQATMLALAPPPAP